MQRSRGFDHNYNLPHKLVDILGYIQPDVTLIEGVEGTIHGPLLRHRARRSPGEIFRVLIAGTNVVATDIVGARVFASG